ncbi:MAG: tetratricopeptide repeat protein, partial [Nitrospinota bacterium]
KETGNKVSSVSQPTADKQEKIQEKMKQMPKVAKKESKEVSKQQSRENENQKTGIEDQEEIKDVSEPDESEKIVAVESKNRKAKPLNKDLQFYLARSYENKKDYSKAFDSYKQILDVDPDNYLVMNNISSLLLHLEAFEESIEYSEMALNIKEDYVPSLINLGIAYIKSGNLTAGEGYLLKVLSIEPSNKHALFNIALLYEKIGEYDKAYGSYQRLSKMRDFQGYLGLARIAEKQNRVADAIMFYTKLMSMEGIDPRIKKMVNDRVHMLR